MAFGHVVGIINPSEKVNGLWLIVAASCFYVLAYRFYGRFLAKKVMNLDDRRRTPAHRLEDGTNFYPANKYILFGHHFAAIAGAGAVTWASARCTIWVSARLSVDRDRRSLGWRRSRFRDSRRFDATKRSIAT